MSGIFTRPKMGPSLGFVTDVFFCRRGVENIMVCSTLEDARAIVLRHRLLFGRRNFGKLKWSSPVPWLASIL